MFPISLDVVGTIQNLFLQWLNQLVNGLIGLFLSFISGLQNIILWAITQSVGGILGFIGIPFSAWSHYVANNGGWFIPIIFVGILGIAFLVGYTISVVYGFEKDITKGEGVISTEEEHIAEEEETE